MPLIRIHSGFSRIYSYDAYLVRPVLLVSLPFWLFMLSLLSLRFSEHLNHRGGVEGKQDTVWEEVKRKTFKKFSPNLSPKFYFIHPIYTKPPFWLLASLTLFSSLFLTLTFYPFLLPKTFSFFFLHKLDLTSSPAFPLHDR